MDMTGLPEEAKCTVIETHINFVHTSQVFELRRILLPYKIATIRTATHENTSNYG
jgi:hypothetical protein